MGPVQIAVKVVDLDVQARLDDRGVGVRGRRQRATAIGLDFFGWSPLLDGLLRLRFRCVFAHGGSFRLLLARCILITSAKAANRAWVAIGKYHVLGFASLEEQKAYIPFDDPRR